MLTAREIADAVDIMWVRLHREVGSDWWINIDTDKLDMRNGLMYCVGAQLDWPPCTLNDPDDPHNQIAFCWSGDAYRQADLILYYWKARIESAKAKLRRMLFVERMKSKFRQVINGQ